MLAASHANTQLAASATVTQAATGQGGDKPAEIAAALAPGRAKGLIGLFSTEGSRQPVSQAVANLWSTPRGDAGRTASLDPADRFFPRQTKSDATAVAPTASDAAAANAAASTRTVQAPLPPSRPVELTQPAGAVQERIAARNRRAPLDLSAFMIQRNGR